MNEFNALGQERGGEERRVFSGEDSNIITSKVFIFDTGMFLEQREDTRGEDVYED
jgi:hypothetical protein